MTVGQRRRGVEHRGQGGSPPDPNRIRWRLEWHDRGPQSKAFSSRQALDDLKTKLENRGFVCRVVDI